MHAKDMEGCTPLLLACTQTPQVVEALIKRGAYLDVHDNSGNTPLHIAAIVGKPETVSWFASLTWQVKLLLEKGADPNVKNSEGETPLHRAAESGVAEKVRILIQHKGFSFFNSQQQMSTLWIIWESLLCNMQSRKDVVNVWKCY